MSASQSYQQPGGHQQVFFKKRASSNTNPPANPSQSIVSGSPQKPLDKGTGSAVENGQGNEKNSQSADPKANEGGKVSSPKASTGAASNLQQVPSSQGQQQSSTSASSVAQGQNQGST